MQQNRSGQSTFDYLILTAVILVVIVPLLFFSTTRIDTNRVAELQDALGALQDGVTQVNNLGFGTSSVVIVRVPKGVTDQRVGLTSFISSNLPGQAGLLQYRVAGNDLYTRVPADVEGILPLDEGLHHIQLFNNGTYVLLYECGNNRREAFEQCDGESPPLGTGDDSACGTISGCTEPSHPQACNCYCYNDAECAETTSLCDLNPSNPSYGTCISCSRNDQCASGKVCLSGQCVNPTVQCGSNADCGYFPGALSGAQVCNKQSGFCELCDQEPRTPHPISTGELKDCNPGHTCQTPGGAASYCGVSPGSTLNSAPVVSAGNDQQVTLPNSLSLQGSVSDDGLPSGILTTRWSLVSGPQPVTFTPVTNSYAVPAPGSFSVSSSAAFTQAGIYIINLSGSDGQLSTSDTAQVTVRCSTNAHCSGTQICTSGQCVGTGAADCGNGILETGETCEFNPTTGAVLINSCTSSQRCSGLSCTCIAASSAYCGNGRIEGPLEECDVGQGNAGTQGTCLSGEVCTAGCLCQSSTDFCGDGRVSPQLGREQCDPALGPTGGCGFGSICTAWCSCRLIQQGYCGDGQYNAFREQCEPGVMPCPARMICASDCECYRTDNNGPGAPIPPRPGGRGGNYQPSCGPVSNEGGGCLGVYCDGDCPPLLYCQTDSSSSNGCSCQPDPGALCQRAYGTSCRNDQDCGDITRYYCGTDNCCNPRTHPSLI